jgi:hypothetical protein
LNAAASTVAQNQGRIRDLEIHEATNTERLKNILTTVERIDKKLNKEP